MSPGTQKCTRLAAWLLFVGMSLTLCLVSTLPASASGSRVLPPGVARNVHATLSGYGAMLHWDAPVSNGGGVITEYVASAHPGVATCSGVRTTCTITVLKPATSYYFTVVARNRVGVGARSTFSNVIAVPAPYVSQPLPTPTTPASHTVTFIPNGGTGSMTPESSASLAALATNTFVRYGYTFTGWDTAADGSGTSYTDGASYSFSISLTLYAQWAANTGPIGSGGETTTTTTTPPTTTTTTPPTTTTTTPPTTTTTAPPTTTTTAPPTTTTTIPSNYTVTFNANGGGGSMPPQVSGTPMALSPGTYTMGGYTFSGWNTEADGSGVGYADGATYSFAKPVTLYAQRVADSYTLSFNSNGGGGSMAPMTSNSPSTISPNTFTRAGYTFLEWNTAANGSGSGYADGDTYYFSSPNTLYAQWVADTYTVTFSPNGGTGGTVTESSNSLCHLSANVFSRPGYSFSGWNTLASGGGTSYTDGALYGFTNSVTLYAQWAPLSYTVTFNANGGAGSMPSQTASGSASLHSNTFTRSGYVFSGWNTGPYGTGVSYADGGTYSFVGALTLYAQWAPAPYTVTFTANGGTGSMSSQSGTTAGALSANTFARAGYVFAGWNTVANGSGYNYADGATYNFSSSVTLYAQWVPILYTVTFNANGGSGAMAVQSSSAGGILNPNTFSRFGYVFAGWNTAPDGSGVSYTDTGYYGFGASTTLYAQWLITYTVTFNANGGAGTMSWQASATPAGLLGNTFTRPGYTFTGWNTAADGSGVSYGNGGYYAFGGSITLYAQWAVAYTVTFNANGGAGSMTSQSSNVATNLNANLFSYFGYSFVGWNTAADGSGVSYTNGATYAFTGSVTLYAQWIAAPITQSTSTNWSGYILTGAPGGYQTVSGSWAVPVLNCAVTPNSAVSVWVGVNGASSSYPGLFQTGTTTLCTNGVETAYAWWTDQQMNESVRKPLMLGSEIPIDEDRSQPRRRVGSL